MYLSCGSSVGVCAQYCFLCLPCGSHVGVCVCPVNPVLCVTSIWRCGDPILVVSGVWIQYCDVCLTYNSSLVLPVRSVDTGLFCVSALSPTVGVWCAICIQCSCVSAHYIQCWCLCYGFSVVVCVNPVIDTVLVCVSAI